MVKHFLKRILCVIGIHWDATTDLGMYGDASKCSICGTDAYDILVLNSNNSKDKYPKSDAVIRWIEYTVLILSVLMLLGTGIAYLIHLVNMHA